MTKYDVRNYLEKIYKIEVKSVHTIVKCGTIKRAPGKLYLIKENDYKRAIVTLVIINIYIYHTLLKIITSKCSIFNSEKF
jgi:ribosomal protein L23